MAETPISDIIRSSLESIKKMADTNTVIGEPINILDHTVIIPVSKVSVGIASGGSDFGGKKTEKEQTLKNFGGGGGSGVTVTPVGFLVVNASGEVKMLNIGENSGYASGKVSDTLATIDGIVEKAPDYIEKIAAIFKKKDPDNNSSEKLDTQKKESKNENSGEVSE